MRIVPLSLQFLVGAIIGEVALRNKGKRRPLGRSA
jgi:hypothetical protein